MIGQPRVGGAAGRAALASSVARWPSGTIGSCCLSFRPSRTSTLSRGRPFVPSWSTLTKSSPTSSSWRCCSSGQPMASSSSSPMPGAGWTSSLWLYVSCFLLPTLPTGKQKQGLFFLQWPELPGAQGVRRDVDRRRSA